MKRILNFSLLAVLATVIFASCSKHDHWDNGNGDKENGKVVYVAKGYEYYSVVQLYDSFAFIETLDNDPNSWPYKYDDLRGTFYSDRDNSVYNVNGDVYTTVRVHGFYDTQSEATLAVNSYINQYGYTKSTKIQRAETRNNTPAIK